MLYYFLGSSHSTAYPTAFPALIDPGNNMDRSSSNITGQEVIKAIENCGRDSSTSAPGTGESNQPEIFRSMKINDASKTPYSDATQVRKKITTNYHQMFENVTYSPNISDYVYILPLVLNRNFCDAKRKSTNFNITLI